MTPQVHGRLLFVAIELGAFAMSEPPHVGGSRDYLRESHSNIPMELVSTLLSNSQLVGVVVVAPVSTHCDHERAMESLTKKCAAEMLGTFWLVMGGCGSAVLAANFGGDYNPLGLGLLGVSLAFGVAVATAAFAFGPLSGGHFNPAVSLGLWIGGRFRGSHLLPYVISQVIGGLLAGALLWTIVNGSPNFMPPSGAGAFATNGYDAYSPGSYAMPVAFLVEVVMTAVFLYVIMAVTRPAAASGWAPFAIGATLALIHMISIPVTNTSVNPARSTAVAAFVGASGGYMPLHQLWLFWLAPCIGGVIGVLVYRGLNSERHERS